MSISIGPGFKRLEEKFSDAALLPIIEEAMDEAVQAGKEEIIDAINTRGTNRVWSRTWYDPDPRDRSTERRYNQGNMLNDVDSRVTVSGRNTVRGEFGWINNSEEYYRAQEYGFTNTITGQQVEGMRAFRDAKVIARDIFEERVASAIDGLYG